MLIRSPTYDRFPDIGMFIHFGYRPYGKVDHVVGLFFVDTRFFHIWFVPLLPVRSYLVRDGIAGDSFRGVAIRLSLKSVTVCWLRAAVCLALLSITMETIILLEDLSAAQPKHPVSTSRIICLAGVFVTSMLLWWFARWLSRPRYQRALQLAKRLGIPPETVATRFDRPTHRSAGPYALDTYVTDREIERNFILDKPKSVP